jgi:hypothetical protein
MLRALDVMCECKHRAGQHSYTDRSCLARVGTCPCTHFRPVGDTPAQTLTESLDATLANFNASAPPFTVPHQR